MSEGNWTIIGRDMDAYGIRWTAEVLVDERGGFVAARVCRSGVPHRDAGSQRDATKFVRHVCAHRGGAARRSEHELRRRQDRCKR